MLEIKSLNKSYKNLKAVDNLTCEFLPGKIYGLLGPNGAGKTTTIRMILNILTPDSGQILFNRKSTNSDFANNVGYLPEERGLYRKSKVENILKYFGKLKGMPNKLIYEKIEYWLKRLDIEKYKNSKLEILSKGNQQKVQFITAIIHNPSVLILDEPFSGFDPMNQQVIKDILKEFIEDQKILIISTHLMEIAENLCSEILLINNGQLLLEDNLDKIKSFYGKDKYKIVFEDNVTIDKNSSNFTILESFDKSYIIKKKDNTNNSNLLKEINKVGNIINFNKYEPTLNEIFLKMVSEKSA